MGISYPGIFIAEAFMKCVAESSHYVISRTQVTKNALKTQAAGRGDRCCGYITGKPKGGPFPDRPLKLPIPPGRQPAWPSRSIAAASFSF
jgi:hypothetical protein